MPKTDLRSFRDQKETASKPKEEAPQNDSSSSFDHNNNAPISQGVVLIYPSIIMVFFSGSLMASGFGNSDSKVCLRDKDLEFDVFRHLLHQEDNL